jgi:LSD1 subclass zinc finger protein
VLIEVIQICNAGLEMAQLICGGCRTLLMYTRSADTVRCSCCNTVNLVRPVNNIAHVNCGRCQTTLMYPYGAHSVKCAICNHITTTGVRYHSVHTNNASANDCYLSSDFE